MTKRTGPLHDPNEDRKLELMMSVFDALKARKARRSEGLFALFSAAGTLLAASDHREEMLKESIEFLTEFVRLNAGRIEQDADNVICIAGFVAQKPTDKKDLN